mmetsp:Transcript_39118/g.59674  ORF Transcript_39118/g.59674 Transcript_39118/m.59674 type:complete len:183 (+) Transcript_39118:4429-4977(+)|eukprot:CAMPEP_0170512630 /NCGR_PEP_ID=MMETSP0208-20121228/66953_1 /TAXON_ID=197538 /ORGANISM="Strombidium inclinatum, Strain S3" /LENGTH=182 /DNA_ID=CAMNT_0010796279 /DNA_START=4412 /DNA_END=4960 /DNA_ORIENTATION=-
MFIHDFVDEMFEAKKTEVPTNRKSDLNKSSLKKLMSGNPTDAYFTNEEFEKEEIKIRLFQIAELIVNKKLAGRRQKLVDNIKANIHPSVPFFKKQRYVESSIEKRILYFKRPRTLDLLGHEKAQIFKYKELGRGKTLTDIDETRQVELDRIRNDIEEKTYNIKKQTIEIEVNESRFKELIGL